MQPNQAAHSHGPRREQLSTTPASRATKRVTTQGNAPRRATCTNRPHRKCGNAQAREVTSDSSLDLVDPS